MKCLSFLTVIMALLFAGNLRAQSETEEEGVRVEITITDENGSQTEVYENIKPEDLEKLELLAPEALKNSDIEFDLNIPKKMLRNSMIGAPVRPMLGIYTQDDDQGLKIIRVIEGSAAAMAGLQENDIILKIDDQEVNSSLALREVIVSRKIGDEIKVQVERNGKRMDLTATLKSSEKLWKPEIKHQLFQSSHAPRVHLGVRYSENDEDALVIEVIENSPAQKAGLKRGDLIKSLDGIPVSEKGILQSLQGKKPGDTIALVIERNGSSKTINVTLGNKPQRFSHPGKRVHFKVHINNKDKAAIASALNKQFDEVEIDNTLSVNMYPNPVDSELTLEIDGLEEDTWRAQLLNLEGKVLMEKMQKPGEKKIKFNLAGQPSGNYLITVIQKNRLAAEKIFKK